MPLRYKPVESLFQPRSLAVLGASAREGSAGLLLTRNIFRAGFAGHVGLVNPRYKIIDDRPCVPSLDDLEFSPDLAVIASPPSKVAEGAREAAAHGASAAIVLASDVAPERPVRKALQSILETSGMRILGPNCLGLIAPLAKLNASLSSFSPMPGDLALISQSGAVASALGSWATSRGVGFSGVVATGDMVDVDFGNLLDHFATDSGTRAILLFVETIGDVQGFMSAARAAARVKPVIALKAGAISDASGPNLTHSAAWADDDAVFEAACRRAGVLRVLNFDSLFEAAETLGRIKPFKGRRLAMVANGPGLGELKAEQLVRLDGELANFSEATQSQLGEFLPFGLAFTNPLNIQGDAKPDQLYQALKVILASKDVDAALVLHAPNAMSQPISSAEAVARATSEARRAAFTQKPVIAVWYGSYAETNAIFEQAQIPHFTHGAIPGFVHVVRWNEAREFLTSTPPSLPESFKPDADAARRIVRSAMKTTGGTEPARKLSTEDATRLLQAYAIPVVPTRVAKTPEEAAELSRLFLGMAGACVVKISSRDLRHRLTAIGGIAFDLKTPEAVAAAARAMLADVPTMAPRSHMDGVTVQPMVRRPNARELLAGLADHPSFGPIVVFGQGGKASKLARDRALALPPLDLSLARDLICRTHASRLFGGYEDVQGIDMDVLALTLVKIAQLAADLPEVRGLEIDPLLTDADGVLAMNATVVVAPTPGRRRAQSNLRFAVAPYPKEQERRVTLADGTRVFIRPVRPEDEGTYSEFASTVPPEDLRLRFFAPVKDFSHAFLARLTQIDYARAYAVAAFEEETGAMLGGVRLMLNADRTKGEFAILVGPQMKGRSLGSALMNEMIENARRFDLEEVEGLILSENEAMLGLCKTLGFRLASAANEPGVMHAVLSLRRPAEDACGLQDTGTLTSYG